MSVLKIETCTMPAADLGPENPLPAIWAQSDLHARPALGDEIPAAERAGFGWGAVHSPLPYRLQDGYGRRRRPRAFQAVVLENEHLRATFLPEIGGRLWSLVRQADGRELLARNPVFQPCNLAIRNAWVSGGVEWNLGWTGHWPLTCEPLFAAAFRLPDGTPGLRMWEWERVRQLPFRIDAWLPAGSPVLLVRVAVHNPHRRTTPLYWWSNAAVEVHPRTRVIVPATSALANDYLKGLVLVGVPRHDGVDHTYPAGSPRSRDFFYRIPPEERPWIAALDETGSGPFQTSTGRLRWRKLFTWGSGAGGRRWQRFLGTPDYIEIQAGLAPTQAHHVPLPPGETWSWIEAYGACAADAAVVHGDDWDAARQAVAAAIEAVVPRASLEAVHTAADTWAARPPAELLRLGSGWGALEELRRRRAGEPPLAPKGIFFPADSLGAGQQPWRTLLEEGLFPESDPAEPPAGYMVQEEWRQLLAQALEHPGGRNWSALFHHGVMLWIAGRQAEAETAWRESLRRRDNPWAAYALGAAAQAAGRGREAVAWLERAHAARPDSPALAIPCLTALVTEGEHARALAAISALPGTVRALDRVRLIEGRALLGTGRLDELEALLADPPTPADLREGETELSDLWFGLHETRAARAQGAPLDDAQRARVRARHPVPPALDFRMNPGTDAATGPAKTTPPRDPAAKERETEAIQAVC